MPDIHLKYGGSTATRTLNCPAWTNLSEQVPKIDRGGAAAQRGTMLHDIMEGYYDREEDLGELCKDLEPADREAIDYAVNAMEQMLNAKGVNDYVCEPLVQLDEDIGGSIDFLGCSDNQVLVVDYKFGYQPIENRDQMLLYAVSARNMEEYADMFGERQVLSVVIQPAVSPLPLVKAHDLAELIDFEERFLHAVEIADGGTKDGNPGPWCKYCPAATVCPAKRAQVAEFNALDPSSAADVARGMALLPEIKEQVKAIEAEAFRLLEAGQKVPGWKLVLKEARRYWTDEAAVMKKLRDAKKLKRDDYIEEKLRSPAQVEKACKATNTKFDRFEEFVDKRSSGTTIAPESDKRDAIETGVVPEALDAIING